MTMKAVFVACLLTLTIAVTNSTTVTLSNVQLPKDQNGDPLITGEADVLYHEGAYYFYFNNWGSCPGVNCCDAAAGCATCCFDHPPHPYLPGCGDPNNGSDPYGLYHTFQAYKTTDLVTWENLGVALTLENRLPGIAFRPHVIYNAKTNLFLMWYEDRGSHLSGYAVAESSTPGGPFVTKHYNVTMPIPKARIGDFDMFVDDDGSAYHVRTGFAIVKLNDNYTGPAEGMSSFSTPKPSEGPVMFKRNGIYYVMSGTGCCACIGGSTIYVQMATDIKGPWTYAGDVGSNPTPFDPHSPNNYVTKAQASAVLLAKGTDGTVSYVWLGNQWNSGLALTPPGPRNHDLLYWSVLQFNENGTVKQFEYSQTAQFDLAPPSSPATAPVVSADNHPVSPTSYPFLYDIGPWNASVTFPSSAVPRVQLNKIFECPHPCGLLPSFGPNGTIVNGGLPQSPDFNMSLHLETLTATFNKFVATDESRYIDLDFESWNPLWEYNSNMSATYNASIALVRSQHPDWTNATQIEEEAKTQFEAAGLQLLIATAQAVRALRPHIKIGLYSFPARLYYNGYNTSAGPELRARNDKLLPLYCHVDAMFPSVYQFYNSEDKPGTKQGNIQYTYSVVAEAVRLAKLVPGACPGRSDPPPVLAYTWHRYHDGTTFLSASDLTISWEQPYAAGADGIIMWGFEPTTMPEFKAWYLNTFAPLANAWSPSAAQ
eukprot:m.186169 g.186169  ORF g.186169 m.186169 type:complete len:710 (-) comp16687_c0_seq1:65-2194(-)